MTRVTEILLCCLFCVFTEAINSTNTRICPSRIHIHTKHFFKLYLDLKENGTGGLFPTLLTNFSSSCCTNNVDIKFINESSRLPVYALLYNERERMEIEGADNDTLKLYFPVYTARSEATVVYKEFHFIHIMRSPGPAFIMLREDVADAPDPSTILVECWPIFLLLFVMAWVVGVIGWFLDHWQNSEQFPNNFYRGSWEGFWWAMVTMTTVGYGDKAPVSFAARVLTVLWMITGTIVTSLFIANVTTVLTTKNVAALQSVMGQKVGVLNSKYFFQTEVNEGASFFEYPDEESLMIAFYNKKVSRVLVPNYLDHLYDETIRQKQQQKILISNVIKRPFSVGLGLVNQVENDKRMKRFLRCWERYIMTTYQENENDYSVIDPKLYHAVDNAKSLLNQNSIMNLIYGLIGLLVLFLSIGSLWEFWKRKHTGSQKMATMEPKEIGMTKQPVGTFPRNSFASSSYST